MEGEEEDGCSNVLSISVSLEQLTSPFFEGEAELQNSAVCAANIHRQKNGGLAVSQEQSVDFMLTVQIIITV